MADNIKETEMIDLEERAGTGISNSNADYKKMPGDAEKKKSDPENIRD